MTELGLRANVQGCHSDAKRSMNCFLRAVATPSSGKLIYMPEKQATQLSSLRKT